jgi:hypothetical protein
MSTTAHTGAPWSTRTFTLMRCLVALAGISVDGHLTAAPPRPRASAAALSMFEQSTGLVLDRGHREYLLYANGWPRLWPIGILGLPELRDRAATARLTAYLAATGDLEAAGLAADDVYPVAWARAGGTAVAVRPGCLRASEVIWFEGITTNVYATFGAFFDAVADRLSTVAGPLAGSTPDGSRKGPLFDADWRT